MLQHAIQTLNAMQFNGEEKRRINFEFYTNQFILINTIDRRMNVALVRSLDQIVLQQQGMMSDKWKELKKPSAMSSPLPKLGLFAFTSHPSTSIFNYVTHLIRHNHFDSNFLPWESLIGWTLVLFTPMDEKRSRNITSSSLCRVSSTDEYGSTEFLFLCSP